MEPGYDIFQRVDGNQFVWVDRVHELQQARNRILNLASASPGTYLIYDAKEGIVLEVSGEHRLTPCAESGENELAVGAEIDHHRILRSFIRGCKRRFAGLNHNWDEFIREREEEETRNRCEDSLRRIRKTMGGSVLAPITVVRQATSSHDEAPMERVHFNISEWAAVEGAKLTTRLFAAVNRISSRLRSVREGVGALACRAKAGHLRWQQALREKRNHLEKLLADSPEPMVITDGALRFVAANPAALALFGVSKTNIGKFAIDAFLSTQQVDFFKHGGPPFVRGATRLGECEIRCFDGRVKVVDYIFQPNFMPGRHLANFRDAHPERGNLQFSSENPLAPRRFPDPRRARSFPEAHNGKPHLY